MVAVQRAALEDTLSSASVRSAAQHSSASPGQGHKHLLHTQLPFGMLFRKPEGS